MMNDRPLETRGILAVLQVSLLTEYEVTKVIHLVEELRRELPMMRNRDDPQPQLLQEAADTAA